MSQDLLRRLPQIEKALRWAEVEPLIGHYSRAEVTWALRLNLANLRKSILEGDIPEAQSDRILSAQAITERLRVELEARRRSGYRRVINATGIVLHTGLGRAVLAKAARESFTENLAGYSLVEVDLLTGDRNYREQALGELLCELTGAAAAIVVNNNAAATLLILTSFARGGEVLISRGQLVEIGGSFRIPDILRESGARLVEVGTTNRTYIDDYEKALGPDTALLLRVHTSNYEIRGFARHTALEELVELGRTHGVTVVSDLGSGCLVDLSPFGFRPEPLVVDSVTAGADLICFSGDKLLGGSQAGLIVGSQDAVARCRSHPLYRALRVDKVTLTLLESTLRLYRDPGRVLEEIPVLKLLSQSAETVRKRAETFLKRLESSGVTAGDNPCVEVTLVRTTSEAGSGSLPAQEIPSWALGLSPAHKAQDLARRLRQATPPVFARVREGQVLLDFRTVLPEDEDELADVLRRLARPAKLDGGLV